MSIPAARVAVCPFTSSLVKKAVKNSPTTAVSICPSFLSDRSSPSKIESVSSSSSSRVESASSSSPSKIESASSSRVVPKSILPFESIPAAKGLPVFGTSLDLIKCGGASQLHTYCDERHKSLGNIFREKMGNLDCVFVADAQLMQFIYSSEGQYPVHAVPEPWTIFNQQRGVQRGLFFMEGTHWSERRKSLNRVFLKQKTISEYSTVFNDVISDLLKRWTLVTENTCPSGTRSSCEKSSTDDSNALVTTVQGHQLCNLERELYNWSIESLGAMIFGTRLGCVSLEDSYVDRIHEFVHCIQQLFVESSKMTMIPAKLAFRLKLPVWRRFERAAERALSLARGYVEENVHRLMVPQKEDRQVAGVLQQLTIQENIDREEVVNIITDLFLAAADTTSHATQWALYLLAKSPECQERVVEEVNQVLAESGDSMIQEKHLSHIPYVKGVIKEALRLYPVAPFLSRVLDKDITLDGFNVPAGKMIVMSLYSTGRMPCYFPRPDSFEPERWARDESRQLQDVLHSAACLPFGLGVRSCIGRRVAEMQMQFLLSRVVQQFKLSVKSDVGIKLRMITTPENPIELFLEPRNKSL